MTPERALEILKSETWWGGHKEEPTEEERAEVKKVWDTLPGWSCFNDALIAIALPLLKEEGRRTYLGDRARIIRRAIKKLPFPPEFDFTP